MAWGQREGGDVAMVYCGELIRFVSYRLYLPCIQTTEKELAFRNQLDLIPLTQSSQPRPRAPQPGTSHRLD